jgi:hypothetical protein
MPTKCNSEAIPRHLPHSARRVVVRAENLSQAFGCSEDPVHAQRPESDMYKTTQNRIRRTESDVTVRRHTYVHSYARASASPGSCASTFLERHSLHQKYVHVQIFSGASRDRVNVTFRGKQSEDSSEAPPAVNPDSPPAGTRRGRLRPRRVSSPSN